VLLVMAVMLALVDQAEMVPLVGLTQMLRRKVLEMVVVKDLVGLQEEILEMLVLQEIMDFSQMVLQEQVEQADLVEHLM